MKFDRKILALSLLFGLGAAIFDNVLDSLFFVEGGFWDLLLFDVPPFELYIRAFILGTFLLFGAIVSRIVYLRRETEARLEHLNQVLRAIREVNHLIGEETSAIPLLDRACEILVSTRGYHSAWAARIRNGRPVEPFHHAGFDAPFAPMADRLKKGSPPLCAQRAMTEGEVDLVLDPVVECGDCPNAPGYPERAGMTAALGHGEEIFGWITVSVPRAYASDPQEHELLREAASDLGRALWNLEAEARRQEEADAAYRAIQESEERFRTLAGLLPEAVFESDQDGNLTYANRRAFELFGYSEGDFADGLNGIEMLVPEDRPRARAAMEERIRGKDVGAAEYTGLRKDGTTFPVLFHAATILKGDEPVGLRGLLVDLTERKETEEELLAGARRMANFLDSSPMGILRYELRAGDELVLVGANPAADRLLGGGISARNGETLEEVFPGLVATEVPRRYRELATRGGTWRAPRFPYELYGQQKVYEVVAFCTAPGEIAVLFLDVTDQDAAEAALRESEARFRGVIEQVNDGIYILFEDRFDLVNRRFCEITGISEAEALAPGFDLWTLVAPESVALIRARQEARARGRDVPSIYPFGLRRRDGTAVHVEASVIEIDYKGGTAVLGLLRDVTEQRSLQNQLSQAQKMESIGRLSGGVAHDLNNLLTPILGFGEMLTHELSEEDQRRGLAVEIVQAALRARELVRQLLAFSRRQTLQFKRLDLNAMVGDFEGLLRRTVPENVEMRLQLAPTLPPIQGDRGQLEQVVMNLAVNGCDAMPEGGVLIIESGVAELDEAYAATHPGVAPGRYSLLAISDTGTGMDPETKARIFEPFFTTKEKGRGTGLGMATVYGIVKQHRGNIWVYSEPGRGSTFRCYFPVDEEAEAEREAEPAAAQTTWGLSGAESVMVVEDEEPVRALTVGILERHGYAVTSAGDGKSCLRALEERDGPLDLLLTDLGLPGMNGRQLYEEVARRHPSVKVLFMSGYSEDVVSHQGVLEGGIDLIQKPFSIQALARKVREVLDGEP